MVPVLLDRLEVPAGLKANSVTKAQRRALEELLKGFTVSVTGPRPVAEAIVTSGGVQVSQVQPSTMESKLAPGLYFAGEILDVDAYTGGFNLQIAWSTGHLAGTSAARSGRRMNMPELYSVAIDGPPGPERARWAKAAAAALGICYVDTGAIYRTIGYGVYCRGIDPSDAAAVAAVLPEMRLELHYDQAGLQRMKLAGRDVTEEIRLPEMSKYASRSPPSRPVRDFLLELQRDQARRRSVIMDGRDIGTVVLPDATVKIFLTAAPEVRAMRRCRELEQRGTPQPYEQVLRDIVDRDWADSHRDIAPCARRRMPWSWTPGR